MRRRKALTAREIAAMGGKARRDKLTPQQRSASARKAANARWQKGQNAEENKS